LQGSGQAAFVHISAFGPIQRRPMAGDVVTFELDTADPKRPRAAKACFVNDFGASPAKCRIRSADDWTKNQRRHQTIGQKIWPIVLTVAIAGAIWAVSENPFRGPTRILAVASSQNTPEEPRKVEPREPAQSQAIATPAVTTRREPTPAYRCEGKTRCPQMSSCAEATFYLEHCPGTEMDGDGDGIPCESQWCGH
jgi:Excalibur calcium-binding domain